MNRIDYILTGLSGVCKNTLAEVDRGTTHDFRTDYLVELTLDEMRNNTIPLAYGMDSNHVYPTGHHRGIDIIKEELESIYGVLDPDDTVEVIVTRGNGSLKHVVRDSPIYDTERSIRAFDKHHNAMENLTNSFNQFLKDNSYPVLTEDEIEFMDAHVDKCLMHRLRNEVHSDEF